MEGDQSQPGFPARGKALSAYLLGCLDFDTLLAFQRRLVYDIGGDRESGAVILCEHPAGITVGREGSRLHIHLSPEKLHAREWPVRWVSRGGGALLHLPGQVACYPILPLDRLKLSPIHYLNELQSIGIQVLREYEIPAEHDCRVPGIRVRNRRIGHVGVAIRNWVSCFGLVLNVDPDLEHFRTIQCDGVPEPMTSAQRETGTRVRVPAIRQHLVELTANRFGFDRVSLFHTHPGVPTHTTHHATSTRTG